MEKANGLNADFKFDISGLGNIFRVETNTGEAYDFSSKELLRVTYNPRRQKLIVLCTNTDRNKLFGYKEIVRTTTCWGAEKPIESTVIPTPDALIS